MKPAPTAAVRVTAADFPPRTTVLQACELLRRCGWRLIGVGTQLFAVRLH